MTRSGIPQSHNARADTLTYPYLAAQVAGVPDSPPVSELATGAID